MYHSEVIKPYFTLGVPNVCAANGMKVLWCGNIWGAVWLINGSFYPSEVITTVVFSVFAAPTQPFRHFLRLPSQSFPMTHHGTSWPQSEQSHWSSGLKSTRTIPILPVMRRSCFASPHNSHSHRWVVSNSAWREGGRRYWSWCSSCGCNCSPNDFDYQEHFS